MTIIKRVKSDQSERLALFRNKINLYQKELAEILNKDQVTISKYENGNAFIPADDIKILHNKYRLSYDWFYDGVGDMLDSKDDKSDLLKEISTLITNYKQLELRFNKLEYAVKKLYSDLNLTEQGA